MHNWQIDPLDFTVLRFPLLPENTLAVLQAADDDSRTSIKQSLQALIKLCENQELVKAIAFASENLANRIHELTPELTADNLKLAASVYKYITRMSTRATPFGAFSGVMLTACGEQTQVNLEAPPTLYMRVDNDCVMALARRVESQASQAKNPKLKVRKNSSLYPLGDELRFVTQQTNLKVNYYQLDSVTTTEAIELVFAHASEWISVGQLAKKLAQQYPTINQQKLLDFIFDLLENQLLESHLGIVVSSKNSFETLYQRCITTGIGDETTRPMQAILERLATQTHLSNTGQALAEAKQLLADLLPGFELNRWLHVDSFRPGQDAVVGADKTASLLSSVQAIAPFLWKKNQAITEFTEKFTAQYGDAAVPLLEALDVDNGILFGPARTGRSPLLKGITPAAGPQNFSASWEPLDEFLMQQIFAAIAEDRPYVQINSSDIKKYTMFVTEPPHGFDDTVAIHGSFLKDEHGAPLYQLKSITGPSSLSLLGRFCCGNEQLAAACKTVAAREQQHKPDAILAEIVHVQQAITANISGRPGLRHHEIVYGPGDSGLPAAQQIKCDDLCLQVQAGRLILFSKTLNKEVKPRLASAHNTGGLNLPVYQFLHALQGSDGWLAGIELSRVFSTLPYLPEIRIDQLIIADRRWVLNRVEIQQLHTHASLEQKLNAFKTLQQEKGITRFVTLTEGDNTLEFDLDLPLSVLILVNEIKSKKLATLTASARGRTDQGFADSAGIFRQEFVLPCHIKHNSGVMTTQWAKSQDMDAQHIKSMTSLPGEQWTYLKIYTGEATADQLIAEQIAPLAQALIAEQLVTQWFFIRYADPDFHLRIRFKLHKILDNHELHRRLYQKLREAYQQGLVKNIVEDSYMPEISRYGGPDLLPVCEQLFYLNSEVVCDALVSAQAHPDQDQFRWQMCLHLAWKLAMGVSDSLAQMEQFFKTTAAAYDLEFGQNPSIKKQLSNNYRLAMKDVSDCLKPDFYTPSNPLINSQILPAYQQTIKQLKTQCDDTNVDVFGIIQSLIHMDCNRMFVINQRGNEWIAYHYLARYSRTVIARNFTPGVEVAAGFA